MDTRYSAVICLVITMTVMFTEMSCSAPPDQTHGHTLACPQPFRFGSVCTYECDAGYSLPSDSTNSIQCVSIFAGDQMTTGWNHIPTPCMGRYFRGRNSRI